MEWSWLGFLVGFLAGSFFGVLIMAILAVGAYETRQKPQKARPLPHTWPKDWARREEKRH